MSNLSIKYFENEKIATFTIVLTAPMLLHAHHILGTWNGNLERQKNKFVLFTSHIRQGDSLLITENEVPSQQMTGLNIQ